MIIKSHIRGGFRAAADYLKEYGQNEKIRLVEISDHDARNLDEAFHNMWVLASTTRATKPLHHISINPMKDERLTDKHVLKIVERCEQKYGYKPGEHQRVIVEHIKDGRQHFHVMWNRVNMKTGRVVWPGQHWCKSKQAAREMEKELGLKRPLPRRIKRMRAKVARSGRISRIGGRYRNLGTARTVATKAIQPKPSKTRSTARRTPPQARPAIQAYYPAAPMRPTNRKKRKGYENIPDSEKMPFRRPEWTAAEIIAWAFENGRADVLAMYGIYVDFGL